MLAMSLTQQIHKTESSSSVARNSASASSAAIMFARSLQSRLRSIGDNNNGLRRRAGSEELDSAAFHNHLTMRLKREAEQEQGHHYCSLPDRTKMKADFEDLMKAKNFHSESELLTRQRNGKVLLNKNRSFEDLNILNLTAIDRSEGSFNDSSTTANGIGDDNKDSDLFFDFDIGSLGDEEEDHEDDLNKSGSDESLEKINNCNSDSKCNKSSTAYGSVSSGLCSDMGDYSSQSYISSCCRTPRRIEDDDEEEGEVIERFLNNTSSSLESSPIVEELPPALPSVNVEHVSSSNSSTPVASINSMASNNEDEKSSEANNDKSSDFTIYSGEKHHKVAKSKLDALLALLGSHSGETTPVTGCSRQNSIHESFSRKASLQDVRETPRPHIINSNSENNSQNDSNGSSPTRSKYRSTLEPISASPANFSFLTSAMEKGQGGDEDSQKENLKRCESTPVLSFVDKAAISESPKVGRKFGPGGQVEVVDSKKSDDDEENSEAKKRDVLTLPLPNVGPDQPRMRRASSLRSGKTPPGTPGRRKAVRFADVFGLDLADVKTFLDEIPKIPKSAYSDLTDADLSDLEATDTESTNSESVSFSAKRANGTMDPAQLRKVFKFISPVGGAGNPALPPTSLVPMFNQPGGFANFFDLLNSKKVCLENGFMAGPNAVKGTIRVVNLSFHKKVTLKYTVNDWARSTDFDASYLEGSCDGFSDKFTFTLTTAPLSVGQRLQFCIRYDTSEGEFWDNNDGRNYVFQCLNTSSSSSSQSTNSAPVSIGGSSSASASAATSRQRQSGGYSHSPSAYGDEPWMRYL